MFETIDKPFTTPEHTHPLIHSVSTLIFCVKKSQKPYVMWLAEESELNELTEQGSFQIPVWKTINCRPDILAAIRDGCFRNNCRAFSGEINDQHIVIKTYA